MDITRRILGPASKYDRRLPYTYEARVAVMGVAGMTGSYVCDTLCGLLDRLADERVDPADVTILEIRPEGEVPVPVAHCLAGDGTWLRRPEACRMFETLYPGHEHTGRCSYRDRSREADGPFIEFETAAPSDGA